MPNPVNNVRGEQWDECCVCGNVFPLSQLQNFKGGRRCSSDIDNLDRERHDLDVARILTSSASQPEGSDRRNVDAAFFGGADTA